MNSSQTSLTRLWLTGQIQQHTRRESAVAGMNRSSSNCSAINPQDRHHAPLRPQHPHAFTRSMLEQRLSQWCLLRDQPPHGVRLVLRHDPPAFSQLAVLDFDPRPEPDRAVLLHLGFAVSTNYCHPPTISRVALCSRRVNRLRFHLDSAFARGICPEVPSEEVPSMSQVSQQR